MIAFSHGHVAARELRPRGPLRGALPLSPPAGSAHSAAGGVGGFPCGEIASSAAQTFESRSSGEHSLEFFNVSHSFLEVSVTEIN